MVYVFEARSVLLSVQTLILLSKVEIVLEQRDWGS